MSTQNSSSPRTKVRKIFKKGDTYLCGLCGKVYANVTEVKFCLNECTKTFLSAELTTEPSPKRYRCSLCKRIHNSMEAAQACATECKKQAELRIHTENRVLSVSNHEAKLKALAQFTKDPGALEALKVVAAEAPMAVAPKVLGVYKKKSVEILAGENVKFMRDKDMFRCLKCKQRYTGANDARACYDGHGDNPIVQNQAKTPGDPRYTLEKGKFRCRKCERLYASRDDAIKCHESHEAMVVGKSGKEEESLVYYRDGAKYVCRKCSKKYFSRDEVQQCFESSHLAADQDPVAVVPAELPPEAPAKNMSRKEEAEIFYRDGAKYVCRGCGKKYFSKEETIACFQAD